MTHRYKIAGLNFEIEGFFPQYAIERMLAYEASFACEPDIKITIEKDCDNISFPDGELIKVTGGSRHWTCLSGGNIAYYDFVSEISPKIINYVEFDKKYKIVKMKLCPSSILELSQDERPFHLIDSILRVVMLSHNRVVMHASAIEYLGNGIIFSAKSGTGKSTHTTLWKENYKDTKIVNDDAPIISTEDGKITLYGSPWAGTSGINENTSSPLSAIVFLERAKENSIRKISGVEAVFRLLNETPKPAVPNLSQLMLDRFSSILKTIPTYVLGCTISNEAVDLVKKELNL